MNPLYEFDDIDDYIQGRMSEPDRAAFEEALQSDVDLARRVEALALESKVFRMLRNEHLLAQLDEWSKEGETDTLPKGEAKGFIPRKWIIGAFIVALSGGLIWVIQSNISNEEKDKNNSPTPTTITKDTITTQPTAPKVPIAQTTPPSTIPKTKADRDYTAIARNSYMDENFSQTLMGTDEASAQTLYEQAVRLYENGKYGKALKLLEKPEKSREQESIYLRGYTYYHLGKYAQAEADFRSFRNYDDSDRKLDAVWCEVFCLAKQLPGSRTRLDAVLKEITGNPKHPYYERAMTLEKSLSEIAPK